MTDRVPVGYVVRAHGIRGGVLVKVLSDDPERFVPGAVFSTDAHPEPVTVSAVKPHAAGVIVSFSEIPDRTAAERLAGSTLTIDPADRRTLPPDEYWPDDLVGLAAVTAGGRGLGIVVDVVVGAAQDRIVVETPVGALVEVPFVVDLVDRPQGGRIVMRPPEGLFDDGSAEVEGEV